MNPSIKLLTIIILGFELTFTSNIMFNGWIILLCIILLLIQKLNIKKIFYLFIVPLLPSIGLLFSQTIYGVNGRFLGWVLFTRVYAYAFIGGIMIHTRLNLFAYSLEENIKLPPKVVYGIISGCEMIDDFINEIKIIRIASYMRGITLHFWSPQLYFKAILVAFRWSNQLAEAMISHGFVENELRTHLIQLKIKLSDILIMIGVIIIAQIPFVFK